MQEIKLVLNFKYLVFSFSFIHLPTGSDYTQFQSIETHYQVI